MVRFNSCWIRKHGFSIWSFEPTHQITLHAFDLKKKFHSKEIRIIDYQKNISLQLTCTKKISFQGDIHNLNYLLLKKKPHTKYSSDFEDYFIITINGQFHIIYV